MSYFGPSSSASQPVTTTADSPDTLPVSGYTTDQLVNYIFRQLGSPTWEVELTRQQIADGVSDAMRLFSIWCPSTRVGNIILIRGQYRYMEDFDVDQGIVDVQFVEPNPVPTEIFYLWEPNQSRSALPPGPGRVRHVSALAQNLDARDQRAA